MNLGLAFNIASLQGSGYTISVIADLFSTSEEIFSTSTVVWTSEITK